jgi:hypothetical protein
MANDSQRLDAELQKLRNNGLVLPRHPNRALQSYGEAVVTDRGLKAAGAHDLQRLSARIGRPITADNYSSPEVQKIIDENNALSRAMGNKRMVGRGGDPIAARKARMQRLYPGMQREAMMGGAGSTPMGGDVFTAIPRFYDPLEYWDLSGLPWNVADEGHRHKLHKWMRLYYATHYLVPILVDIFTRFPLVGLELEHDDPGLVTVYEDMFLDQLKYESFLVGLGREFWLCGEAFPLGSFDEDLGIWEHEELINPEDVVIDNFPLLGTQQLKIVAPDYLRRIAQTKQPAREWYMLQSQFPDLIEYLLKGEHIPISPVMLRQVANKMSDWDDHGTPILLRGLRTLIHEEKLLASQDAIAERLYSPFILVKLGIMDMGDGLPPWVPTPDELQSVRDDIDIAMASDFRVLVHHFGLEMENVFGREQMPRLGDDFDRIERRLMQIFGISPALLNAGASSQPYASSALQAEFMNQILRTFQQILKDHFHERAMVVAEAQGHVAYEKKGQTRVPIYETVVEWDEDGEKRLVKKPKYTCPELTFASFDLRDEATERMFLMGLRQAGVPIPDDKLMLGVSWRRDDYIEDYNRQTMHKTISQQRAKMDTYIALVIQGLPVPMDLKYEIESVLMRGQTGPEPPPAGPEGAGGGQGQLGGTPGAGGPPPGGGGGQGGTVMPPPPPDLFQQNAPPGGGTPPIGPNSPQRGTVPEASNERRKGLQYNSPIRASVEGSLATDEELAEITKDWPEEQRKRAVVIRDQLELGAAVPTAFDEKPVEAAASLDPSEDEDDPTTWKLKRNQKLEEHDGKQVIIASKAKRRVELPVPTGKKYSIIDPLAVLDVEENVTVERGEKSPGRSEDQGFSNESSHEGNLSS